MNSGSKLWYWIMAGKVLLYFKYNVKVKLTLELLDIKSHHFIILFYWGKGSTLYQAFQAVRELCFLWENLTPFSADFGLFHFAHLLHAQQYYIPQWRKGKYAKKHSMASLTYFFLELKNVNPFILESKWPVVLNLKKFPIRFLWYV